MPTSLPPIISLKDLFALKRLPRRLPLIYLTSREMASLTSDVTWVKRLPKAGHRARITPFPGPGGGLKLPCIAA